MGQRTDRARRTAAVMGLALALTTMPDAARATESGASLYLLGSGGPGTAVMPPVEGVYLDKLIWVYDGSASAERSFPINGNIAAGIDTTIVADFPTMLFVPTTHALGGTLALGVTVPFGAPLVDVEALLTTPGGPSLSGRRHDTALTTGDPVLVGMLGWKAYKLHVQLSTMVNVPVGNYRDGALANTCRSTAGQSMVLWRSAGTMRVRGGTSPPRLAIPGTGTTTARAMTAATRSTSKARSKRPSRQNSRSACRPTTRSR